MKSPFYSIFRSAIPQKFNHFPYVKSLVKSQCSSIFHGELSKKLTALGVWAQVEEVRHLVYRFQRLANLSSAGTVDFNKMQLLEAPEEMGKPSS